MTNFIIALSLAAASFFPIETSAFGADCGSANNFSVVVDEITFSDSSNKQRENLSAFFEIPLNTCIERTVLDEGINQARSRLDALGEYKSVVVSLQKGAERNHYIIDVKLESLSPYYSGARFTVVRRNRNTMEYGSDREPENYRAWQVGAYGGTRSFLNTKMRLDLDIDYTENAHHYERDYFDDATAHSSSHDYNRTSTLNLFHPNILDKNFIFGLTILDFNWYSRNHSVYGETDNEIASESDSKGNFKLQYYNIKFGYRWNYLTLSPTFARYVFYSSNSYSDRDGEQSNYRGHMYSSVAGFSAAFATKSFLAAVEPGVFAKLTYSRTVAEEFDFPSFSSYIEWTFFVLNWLAFTPEFTGNYTYDEDYDDQPVFHRHYETGMRSEFIFYHNLVLLTRAIARYDKGGYSNEDDFFSRRYEIYLSYLTYGFKTDLGFILGGKELSFDNFDKRRVAE